MKKLYFLFFIINFCLNIQATIFDEMRKHEKGITLGNDERMKIEEKLSTGDLEKLKEEWIKKMTFLTRKRFDLLYSLNALSAGLMQGKETNLEKADFISLKNPVTVGILKSLEQRAIYFCACFYNM